MHAKQNDFIKFLYKGQLCVGWVQVAYPDALYMKSVTDLLGNQVTGTGHCTIDLDDVQGLPIQL